MTTKSKKKKNRSFTIIFNSCSGIFWVFFLTGPQIQNCILKRDTFSKCNRSWNLLQKCSEGRERMMACQSKTGRHLFWSWAVGTWGEQGPLHHSLFIDSTCSTCFMVKSWKRKKNVRKKMRQEFPPQTSSSYSPQSCRWGQGGWRPFPRAPPGCSSNTASGPYCCLHILNLAESQHYWLSNSEPLMSLRDINMLCH